jgi:hypothetical protein
LQLEPGTGGDWQGIRPLGPAAPIENPSFVPAFLRDLSEISKECRNAGLETLNKNPDFRLVR